jgi:uncharacterized protein (TIGR02391 family)
VSRVGRLDPILRAKIAKKRGISEKSVREQNSRRASRLGISAEASLVGWAKELGIGINLALRRMAPHVQEQVRSSPSSSTASKSPKREQAAQPATKVRRPADPFAGLADELLSDPDLRARCKDLFRRRKIFDTAMREATTVLEDRIRSRAGITDDRKAEDLVNSALNPDPKKAILVLSTKPSEQLGFHGIYKGIFLAFRNKTHHKLSKAVTKEEAWKFCGFVDLLLVLLDTAAKQPPRQAPPTARP